MKLELSREHHRHASPVHPPNVYDTTKNGTEGSDLLEGTAGRDKIIGRGGGDDIYGFADDDFLIANTEQDRGETEVDRIIAGAGNDLIYVSDRDRICAISASLDAREGWLVYVS